MPVETAVNGVPRKGTIGNCTAKVVLRVQATKEKPYASECNSFHRELRLESAGGAYSNSISSDYLGKNTNG